MNPRSVAAPRVIAVAATILAIAVVVLTWTASIDRAANDHTNAALKQALVAYAAARVLNGVISMAQGTQLALQPAGVGVTLSIGEVLDPVNDLIERFSWIVLAASAALGAQILVAQVLAGFWMNVCLTAIAVTYLAVVWLRPDWRWMHKVALAALFIRFVLVSTMLLASIIGDTVIGPRQQSSLSALEYAADSQAREPAAAAVAPSLRSRLDQILDSAREALDVEQHLHDLKAATDRTIALMIDLVIVFIVQSVVLPLLTFAFILFGTRELWRRL